MGCVAGALWEAVNNAVANTTCAAPIGATPHKSEHAIAVALTVESKKLAVRLRALRVRC
jgi:hypothetical protein